MAGATARRRWPLAGSREGPQASDQGCRQGSLFRCAPSAVSGSGGVEKRVSHCAFSTAVKSPVRVARLLGARVLGCVGYSGTHVRGYPAQRARRGVSASHPPQVRARFRQAPEGSRASVGRAASATHAQRGELQGRPGCAQRPHGTPCAQVRARPDELKPECRVPSARPLCPDPIPRLVLPSWSGTAVGRSVPSMYRTRALTRSTFLSPGLNGSPSTFVQGSTHCAAASQAPITRDNTGTAQLRQCGCAGRGLLSALAGRMQAVARPGEEPWDGDGGTCAQCTIGSAADATHGLRRTSPTVRRDRGVLHAAACAPPPTNPRGRRRG